MLSAFRAEAILEHKQRDKSKIESLLAYGDRVLVGLNTGVLRVYRVSEASPSREPDTEENGEPVGLLREEDKFGKKPLQQLAMVKEANLLVSLSDACVSLHDLQTYKLVERLERTKGAACFAVSSNVVKDPDTKVPSLVSRLAVGTKRKLLCWTWQDMELLPDVSEISLEATIKSLVWADGNRLIAGMDPGFSVIDVTSEEIVPVVKHTPKTTSTADISAGELVGVRFGAVSSSGMGYMGMGSWVPKPMATPCTGLEVLLAKDVNTLFISVDGKPLEKRQVPWAVAPEAIGYSYPYLLALTPPEKGSLQIRNPDTLSLLQTISVPGASILHVPQPNISLAHAGKGFLVASDRVIWRMNALPYDAQFTELLGKQRFDEAISLVSILEDTLINDKEGRIREFTTLKAISLFQQQKYLPALDLFTDAQTAPDQVIALYPRSIAGDLSNSQEDDSDDASSSKAGGKNNASSKETPTSPSKGMLSKFIGGGRKDDSDAASIKSPARTDTDNLSVRTKSAKTTDRLVDADDLKAAARSLNSFLAQTRGRIQKYLNPDGILKEDPPSIDSETGRPPFYNLLSQSVAKGKMSEVDWQSELLKSAKLVDTTLFRSYMLATPTLAGSLFRIDNWCDPDVVQTALYEGERYNDLIDFLHGKKLHRQALEMLQKFGKGEADGNVPESMLGPEQLVSYLKQLPPSLVDLVLEFDRWPIESKPEIGMEVFLADSDNAENLPRHEVLKFLASVDNSLQLQYLEHIINELGDDESDFHQQLIDLYLEKLKSNEGSDEERVQTKARLESILSRSGTYNKTKTFRQLPADDPLFYESRALVVSAMGNHKQALSIYVFQIRDYEKAEAYCNKTYLQDQAEQQACLLDGSAVHEKPQRHVRPDDSSEKPNIFAILLGLYLRPPAGEEKRWPEALELLGKHGARLPASSTLDLMPDDLAVQELQDYFRGRIRHATSVLREGLIVKSLEGARRANTDRLLSIGPDENPQDKPLGRNRRVRIGEEDRCKVCHKRFGASAIRVYPDNQVIHYGCIGRSGPKRQTTDGATGFGALRKSNGWT